jgi:Spy/CpxP family protein refolding chaperone
MFRTFRNGFALALALTVGFAAFASAQGQAEFKRQLKAGALLYKEPGLMEVDIKSMKDEMMLTGTVATAEQSAKAEEIIKGVRGVKKVRNRLRVGAVEECSKANDAELSKKIEEQIANDEELTQARRKFELTMKDRNLVVTGELKDYAQAGSLINLIKRVPCLNSLDYEKLEY